LGFLIYTVSTKGQSRQCHPLQSFANEHSLLEFIAKNLEPDTAWTDENSGLILSWLLREMEGG